MLIVDMWVQDRCAKCTSQARKRVCCGYTKEDLDSKYCAHTRTYRKKNGYFKLKEKKLMTLVNNRPHSICCVVVCMQTLLFQCFWATTLWSLCLSLSSFLAPKFKNRKMSATTCCYCAVTIPCISCITNCCSAFFLYLSYWRRPRKGI